jgi:hypothetical protein
MPAIGAIEVFVFRQGQFVGSRMFSPDRVVSIGRALDQGLRLDDEEVSSRHASLRVVDGKVVISDAGSRNGVYVNGRKVQSAKVSSFDEILVGSCRLKIDIVGGSHDEDPAGVEKTRVGAAPTGPGGPVTQPPRSAATSTFVPRMAEMVPPDASSDGPTTAQFMRTLQADPEAPVAPPAPPPAHFAPPVAPPAQAAPPVAPPAAPPHAAPPHGGGRTVAFPSALRSPLPTPAAPPQFVDEDARTASIEFAPPAPAPQPAAGGTYWDFDEESATQPGRSLREPAPPEESHASHATRALGSLEGAPAAAARVIVDPQAATAPADVVPPPRAPAAPPPRAPLPFPQMAAPEPAPPAPARPRTPGPRGPEVAAPPPGLSTATVRTPPPVAPTPYAAPPQPVPPPSLVAQVASDEASVPYSATPRIDADAVLASETPADGIAGTVDTAETAPAVMAPPRLAAVEEEELDDDEIEERDWVEPFSLLENVLRDHPKDATATEQPAILEMIRYRERRIIDLVRLHRGEDFISFGGVDEETKGRFKLIKFHRDGRAQLYFTEATQGSVVLGGVTTPLRDLCVEDRLSNRRKQIFTVMLCEGDYAQILLESGGGFLMRFVKPPAAPPHTFSSDFTSQDAIFMGCGVGAIIIILLGMWGLSALAGPADIKLQEEELTFAQVSLKDAQLQKPDEKKPELAEVPGAEMPMLEKVKVVARDAPRRTKSTSAAPGPPGPPAPAKPAGVLSALNDMKPAADSGDNALRAAVSNIAAVRVPGGTSSAFQVSGTFSKLPGGEVRLATGGGGGGGKGRETRVGAELFRGEKGAKLGGLTGPAGGGGKIRGAVKSAGAPVTRGGILDAAAVQRVVSAHLAAIQGCYERQLLKDPGLQGKITFDWDVAPSGSVSSARMVSSTMGTGGSTVAACIVAEIRRWKFPSPVGGTASVRYPFIFRMSGF